LRPVAILDLISYIFFLKKLDEGNLISKGFSDIQSDHFILSKEIEEFTWTKLKDMDAQAIHDLFTRQYGIIDLMNNYGQTDLLYSNFFKAPLLIKPTPKLLFNVIEIDNLIEASDVKAQEAIIEYLLSKAEKAQKGLTFIPQYLSRLMISIAEPQQADIICDLSTGFGTLLISAVDYLKSNETGRFQNNLSSKVKGVESDIGQLRLTAMRMMLHGIKYPDLKLLADEEINFTEKPTLFISDLLFAGVEENATEEENIPAAEKVTKDAFLLTQIVKNLQPGARAVALVPENLLKSTLPEIQKTRKEIVDNTNLEGVIQLFPESKLFSAAAILVFNKNQSAFTSEVWFCKMDKPKKRRTVNEIFTNPEQNAQLFSEELNQVNLILDNWKNRKERSNSKPNSFFISAYDIKTNNYNLNYNDYKLIPVSEELDENESAERDESDIMIATKKENLEHFFQPAAPLSTSKRKRKVAPVILVILVLIIGGAWLYLNYFKGEGNLYYPTAVGSDSATSKIHAQNASLPSNQSVKIKKSIATKKVIKAPDVEKTPKTITSSAADSSQSYTVINKTWFHYAPDSTKRKAFYLEPRENLLLKPTAEQNGFVYVVYINKKGESTRGWLSKKDLEPVE
jgi:type I restriction enzyme M protein